MNSVRFGLLCSILHFTMGDTGGSHHVHDHGHQGNHESLASQPTYNSQTSGKCAPSYDVVHLGSALQSLDYEMHSTLAQLPAAIKAARSAIESGNTDVNRDQFLVGLFCLIGALSGSLGILHNKNPLTLSTADQIYLASMNAWGYGYWGPYLLELNEADPGCGVKDFNRVVYEYNFVTSLQQVYGSDPSSGGYQSSNADDKPELRRYYIGEFSRKLKLALHCITSKGESVEEARQVVSLIDKFTSLSNERLDATIKLIH